MENQNVFVTKDICLAATLITLKFRMEGIDFQYEGIKQRPIGFFQFDNTLELKRAKDDFWQGQTMVEPREFMINMRGIKAQLESVYKAPSYQDYSENSR